MKFWRRNIEKQRSTRNQPSTSANSDLIIQTYTNFNSGKIIVINHKGKTYQDGLQESVLNWIVEFVGCDQGAARWFLFAAGMLLAVFGWRGEDERKKDECGTAAFGRRRTKMIVMASRKQ
ncbi:hypothetical protein HAX54_010561 [Datura stramonium]|uniref:Uncharacterized protein n=1 Tax=Datura stramonium TaxID=4076 RepID=A0ABS8THW6_DATST|nr:hypothetical protein [Datura stramonium]